jgi:hypothetical protein
MTDTPESDWRPPPQFISGIVLATNAVKLRIPDLPVLLETEAVSKTSFSSARIVIG